MKDINFTNLHDLQVSDLLSTQRREWNSEALARLFPIEERRLIEQVRIIGGRNRDAYIWDYSKTVHYSVKSGYWFQVNIIDKMAAEVMVDQPSLEDMVDGHNPKSVSFSLEVPE